MIVPLLERDREAPVPDAPPPAIEGERPTAPDVPCATCGAAMSPGQDWCLECGSAAPGRLGAKPAGWRAAFTLVAATLLLVGGAVVASYAALTSDAEREATRPSAGNGAPIVAQAPPAQAPAAPAAPTGPGTAPKAQPNAPRPKIRRPVTPPVSRAPAQPSTPAPTPAAPAAPAAPAIAAIPLKAGAASTYDPYKRPGAEFGSARKATDGKPDTVWDVTLPADGQPVRTGLVVDLGGAYKLDALQITTPTPGFTVELYGTDASGTPDDILDKRWTHLTDGKAVADGQTISLKGKTSKRLRSVVLWFTAVGDAADPRVAIGEVGVRGTK
jgi:hypothetical protein